MYESRGKEEIPAIVAALLTGQAEFRDQTGKEDKRQKIKPTQDLS